MFDWKSVVREKLGGLPLDPEKHDEIVEELTQQLEAAYHDELAKGADRFQAVRRSMAQFRDWEKLRNDVFQSVKGTRMPVWEQRGIFAPRRPLVWISLALALGFLLLPAFRKALNLQPFTGMCVACDEEVFSDNDLRELSAGADQQKYARALAYVALHSRNKQQSAAAAEKAIARDPQLTWIAARVGGACCGAPVPDVMLWIDRLEKWDPDNAYPHLLRAQAIFANEWKSRWSKTYVKQSAFRKMLAAEPRWRAAMEKAFSAPRMDSYAARNFVLDRDVLLERGLDDPQKLLTASASTQLPDIAMLEMYADYLVLDEGGAEERAGHVDRALSIYRDLALFGQKMAGGSTTLEQMASAELRKRALQKMIPLLRKHGRDLEATNAELALAAMPAEEPKPPADSGQGSRGYRSGQIIWISGLTLIVLAIAAMVWMLCVVILRVNPNFSRDMNWLASHLGWAPVLLPISSLVLFVAFLPYARSIAEFSQHRDLVAAYDSLYFGLYSFHFSYPTDFWIHQMFWPLIWCASVALLGAAALRWVRSRGSVHQTGLD